MPNKKEIFKKLKNTRILKNYGSWIYCDKCNKTVAYLCYTTYCYFKLTYNCQCKNKGLIEIGKKEKKYKKAKNNLIINKNRLCCPEDNSPLFSIIEKRLNEYSFEIICKKCNTLFTEQQK